MYNVVVKKVHVDVPLVKVIFHASVRSIMGLTIMVMFSV